jgi:predicted hydrocarbon binding protein
LIVNGTAVGYVTGASLKIDGKAANMGAVVGANTSPDVQRGRISVSGQLTVYLQDTAMTVLYEAGTKFGIVLVVAESSDAAAKFVSFSMSACKYTGDSKDDGEKGIIQTMPFTAELNSAGGAALANDKTIISIQDSDA